MRVTGDHVESSSAVTDHVQRVGSQEYGRREIRDQEHGDFLLSFAVKASREIGGSWLGRWSQSVFLSFKKKKR